MIALDTVRAIQERLFDINEKNINKIIENQNQMLINNINTLNKIWEQNQKLFESLTDAIITEKEKVSNLEKIISSLRELINLFKSKIIRQKNVHKIIE